MKWIWRVAEAIQVDLRRHVNEAVIWSPNTTSRATISIATMVRIPAHTPQVRVRGISSRATTASSVRQARLLIAKRSGESTRKGPTTL